MTEYPYGSTAAPPQTPTFGTPEVPTTSPSGSSPSLSQPSPSLSDKASDTADAGKQAAADVAQTATEKAKDVAQETKKQARDLVGEARGQLTEQAGAQHRNLVSNLHALADELNGMAQRSENGGVATDLVSQAGDRAKSAAGWLDQREPGDLVQEVRRFARQRPGTFLLGAALAGLVVGRLTRGAVDAHSSDNDNNTDTTTDRHTDIAAAQPTTVLPTTGYAGSPAGAPSTAGYSGAAPGGSSASLPDGAYSMPPTGYGTGVVGEPTP